MLIIIYFVAVAECKYSESQNRMLRDKIIQCLNGKTLQEKGN